MARPTSTTGPASAAHTDQPHDAKGPRLRIRRWLPWAVMVYGVVILSVVCLTFTAHHILRREVQHKVRGLAATIAYQVIDAVGIGFRLHQPVRHLSLGTFGFGGCGVYHAGLETECAVLG